MKNLVSGSATRIMAHNDETADSEIDRVTFSDPAVYGQGMKFSIEFETEAPPRDIRKLFEVNETFEMSSNLPGVDGEYRHCEHCDNTIVEVGYYEEHLAVIHELEP